MGRKSRKKKERRVLKSTQRTCGECTECCTSLGVDSAVSPTYTTLLELAESYQRSRRRLYVWHKPHRETCEHVTDKGCGVYGEHPEACQAFQCEWLHGMPVRKPNESGLVFFEENTDAGTTLMVSAREDSAFYEPANKVVIDALSALLPVILMHDGDKRTFIKDGERKTVYNRHAPYEGCEVVDVSYSEFRERVRQLKSESKKLGIAVSEPPKPGPSQARGR